MNRNEIIDANLSINDVNVESTDSIKVLGVTLDAKLNFNEHIKNLCNRASHQINALKRISRYLDIDGRLRIYQAFIKSNFTYCPVSWIFCGKRNSDKLEKLQERALRVVYNEYSMPYRDLLLHARILPLSMLRLKFLGTEVFKSVKGLNPEFLNEMFQKRNLKYDFRDSNKLHQNDFDTKKFGFKSYKYYGAKLWNALPPHIKAYGKDDLDIFKEELNKWCFTEQASKLEIE